MVRVALTFDDGYLDHYLVAKTLYRQGVRGTFFIITGLAEFEGRRLITSRPDLLRRMVGMGHELGAHSTSHPDLTSLRLDVAEEEIQGSKRALELLSGQDVLGFAYPYGDFNEEVKEITKRHFRYARAASTKVAPEEIFEVGATVFGADVLGVELLSPRRTVSLLFQAAGKRDGEVVALFHRIDHAMLGALVKLTKTLDAEFVTLAEMLRL